MTESNDVKQGSSRLNPAALTVEMTAKMLGIQVQIVQKHIEEGSPVTADGTINLVHYGAWLNASLQSSDLSYQQKRKQILPEDRGLKAED